MSHIHCRALPHDLELFHKQSGKKGKEAEVILNKWRDEEMPNHWEETIQPPDGLAKFPARLSPLPSSPLRVKSPVEQVNPGKTPMSYSRKVATKRPAKASATESSAAAQAKRSKLENPEDIDLQHDPMDISLGLPLEFMLHKPDPSVANVKFSPPTKLFTVERLSDSEEEENFEAVDKENEEDKSIICRIMNINDLMIERTEQNSKEAKEHNSKGTKESKTKEEDHNKTKDKNKHVESADKAKQGSEQPNNDSQIEIDNTKDKIEQKENLAELATSKTDNSNKKSVKQNDKVEKYLTKSKKKSSKATNNDATEETIKSTKTTKSDKETKMKTDCNKNKERSKTSEKQKEEKHKKGHEAASHESKGTKEANTKTNSENSKTNSENSKTNSEKDIRRVNLKISCPEPDPETHHVCKMGTIRVTEVSDDTSDRLTVTIPGTMSTTPTLNNERPGPSGIATASLPDEERPGNSYIPNDDRRQERDSYQSFEMDEDDCREFIADNIRIRHPTATPFKRATPRPIDMPQLLAEDISQNILKHLQRTQEEQLILRIGERDFCTSRVTLRADSNSLFAAMLEPNSPFRPYGRNMYYIDRDCTHFRTILSYLRNGAHLEARTLPSDERVLVELLIEARFYMCERLQEIIQAKLEQVTGSKDRF